VTISENPRWLKIANTYAINVSRFWRTSSIRRITSTLSNKQIDLRRSERWIERVGGRLVAARPRTRRISSKDLFRDSSSTRRRSGSRPPANGLLENVLDALEARCYGSNFRGTHVVNRQQALFDIYQIVQPDARTALTSS